MGHGLWEEIRGAQEGAEEHGEQEGAQRAQNPGPAPLGSPPCHALALHTRPGPLTAYRSRSGVLPVPPPVL